MKKFFTLVAATTIAALSLISTNSNGSHCVGADITYEYVGPNQYLITLRFYRDCFGVAAPTIATVNYYSSAFPAINSLNLNLVPGSGIQVPTPDCLPPNPSTCIGGTGYGVEEFIYQGLVTLAGPSVDWTFSFQLCCRNAQINTITNPDFYSIYVASTLDNFNYPVNSSPEFFNIPVTQFCVGGQFYYNQGATDADGDSLVFSLVAAEDNAGIPLPYAPGYSPTTPLSSSTPITINSQTGTINFTPNLAQVGVIAVLCEEYRNGTKIGQVKRDIQMNVVGGCILTPPNFVTALDSLGNPTQYVTGTCGDTSLYLVFDELIQCFSIVPTDIRILTPQGLLNPAISATPVNCLGGLTDSILVTFFYPLTAGTTIAYTKEGFDNNTFLSECGVPMAEFDSLFIEVVDPGIFDLEVMDVGCTFDNVTVTFDYEVVCSTVTGTGSEFYLIDANNVTYPVTSVSNCPGGNGYSATLTFHLASAISPATPVYLYVQNGTDANTFTNRCNTFIQSGDTLAELNVLSNLIVNLGGDNTICDTDPLPVLDAGVSGATYVWYHDNVLLSDTTQSITASTSGVYSVFVTATPSCNGTDTVSINILSTPVVTLPTNMTLCASDPIPTLDAGNFPGASFQWYESGVAIPGQTMQFFQPTTSGNYSVIVLVGTSCSGTDDVTISINTALVVELPLDETICSNDTLPLLDAGVPNAFYQWFQNGSQVGGNTQTYQTTGPGVYSVNVTTVSGCTGTDSYLLSVINAPVVDLGADTTVCTGDVLILDAGNTPGATYQWYESGNIIPGETNFTYQPTASGNYSVIVNTGGQCTGTGDVLVTILQQVIVAISDVAICSDQAYPELSANIPNATYSWTLNGFEVSTDEFYTPTAPGNYELTVTAGNCSGSDVFTVGTVPAPVVSLNNPVICPGATVPPIDAGNPGATYLWNTGETSNSIIPSGPGTYTVTVTNSGLGIDCSATGTSNVTTATGIAVTLGGDEINCEGDPTITIDAGNPGSAYAWSLNGTALTENTQVINVDDPGTYVVVVTDPNGCTGTDDLLLTVNANPVVDLGVDVAICQENELPVLDATNPNAVTYSWTHDGAEVGTAPTYQPDHYGEYTVTVVDNNGCVGIDIIAVGEAPCEVEIPNVITPDNGDGLNDVFFIKNLDSNPNSQLVIFNRWGKEVYESSNYQNNWTGDGLPDATYFYSLVLQTGKKYDGTFKIIRVKQ